MMNMKKSGKTTGILLKISAAAGISLFCLADSETVKAAVTTAVTRCLNTVIPSLYGMMIISSLLISSGIIGNIPHIFSMIGRRLFKMNGPVFPIYVFSLFAGYPVGAKMLFTEYEKGSVDRRSAELFSGICFGAGPAFIFGCISSQLYGSPAAGYIIIISTLSANTILALFVSRLLPSVHRKYTPPKLKLDLAVVNDSIMNGAVSIMRICAMTGAFSIITAFLQKSGVISRLSGIIPNCRDEYIFAVLDITAIGSLPVNDYSQLPVICGLTAFGGLCVFMQIASLTKNGISLLPMLFIRTAAAFVSSAVCRLLLPFMLKNVSLSAASMNVHTHQAASPIPSVMLIIMTFISLSEYDRISLKRKNTLSR